MERAEREALIALLNKEVVPAIGCTEPIAVALAVARAGELLERTPEKVTVRLSANILKNAMGVGIPGTGMIGLPIAVALGALIGKSEYGLEVLKACSPEAVAAGREMIARKAVSVQLKEGTCDTLYIEAVCSAGNDRAIAVISGEHTRFVYLEKNGRVLSDRRSGVAGGCDEPEPELTLRKVYEFAATAPLEELTFIRRSAELNMAAAERAFEGDYGHALGKILQGPRERALMGDTVFSRILSYTSAACDARMAGAMIPVMSNSGSGNQGIAATLPVAVYARDTQQPDEAFVRALILSHLTVVYIKQSLGRLSALCGCVVAATGSACGLTYLMGGSFEQITFSVQNMVANLTGMICDGAKPSCALKVTSGVSTALFSALMAMENRCVTSVEGIVDREVDRSIRNLTRIGSQGMLETDKLVLEIMTTKS